jgi:WD40 repeat protein
VSSLQDSSLASLSYGTQPRSHTTPSEFINITCLLISYIHYSISSARLLQNSTHTGPVRALHFNPLQHSLLASGGPGSELYIWDLKNPATPYTPGARSQRLDGISSLAWNAQVAHILASSSPSGHTVVWDLRGKREVVALQYGGGANAGGGPGAALSGAGLRRGMSDVAWHPDNVRVFLQYDNLAAHHLPTRQPA